MGGAGDGDCRAVPRGECPPQRPPFEIPEADRGVVAAADEGRPSSRASPAPGDERVDLLVMMRAEPVEQVDPVRTRFHGADPDAFPVAGCGQVSAVGREAERLDLGGELAGDQTGDIQGRHAAIAVPPPGVDLAVAVAGDYLFGVSGTDRGAGDGPRQRRVREDHGRADQLALRCREIPDPSRWRLAAGQQVAAIAGEGQGEHGVFQPVGGDPVRQSPLLRLPDADQRILAGVGRRGDPRAILRDRQPLERNPVGNREFVGLDGEGWTGDSPAGTVGQHQAAGVVGRVGVGDQDQSRVVEESPRAVSPVQAAAGTFLEVPDPDAPLLVEE